jgi:uncharacterized protein YndB with AHSA1/START domain
MFTYQESIDIHAPAADVFATLSAAEKIPDWVGTTLKAVQLSDGQASVGTRLEETVAIRGNKENIAQLVWEITEFDENRHIAFETNTDWGYQKQAFTLEPLEHGTRLLVNGQHGFKGFRRLMRPVLSYFIKQARRQHLASLKQILEGERLEG